MAEWDVIVVGAGVVGSWTAYHLTHRSQRTLLLDQYSLPHTRGSSSSQGRLVSMDFPNVEDRFGLSLMRRACDLWGQLEKETGTQLMHQTGILTVATDGSTFPETIRFLETTKLPHEKLDGGELKRRYPQAQYGSEARAILDPQAGIVMADQSLGLLRESIVKHGGKIQDNEKMLSFSHSSQGVTITTSRGSYTAKKLVVCAGPWTKDVLQLPQLPLKTMPGLHVYWSIKDPAKEDYSKLPMMYHRMDTPGGYRFFLLFPTLEYPGMVKIVMRGEPVSHYLHPDMRDSQGHEEMLGKLQAYITKTFPGIHPQPSIIEPCVYTMSPDRGFIIDYHPTCPDIVIGAGFSGNGFKASPVVGEMLCDMVMGNKPDVSPFSISRFQKAKL